jgi:hypothetical protein
MVGLLALAVSGLAACELPVPPAALVVTTELDGPDAVPGDGVCEMTAGLGDCSFSAAVGEGNALGAAAITLPVGSYYGTSFTVTGDITINVGAPVDARISQWITIAAGASLVVDGLSEYNVPGARFEVFGSFVGNHLSFVGLESSGQVVVRAGGTAVVQNSILAHVFGSTASVQNAGTVVLRNVALLSSTDLVTQTVALLNNGTAYVASSALQTCGGANPPISLGYNNDHANTCGLTSVGDLPSMPPNYILDLTPPITYDLAPTSPLVDAIPVGVNGCGTEIVDDMSFAPRPVDGNGDGIVGCDIGARELPATP